MELSAENAYLFRHAIVREAAYQLILPSARAELHGAAIIAFEARGADFANRFAAELAGHARLAGNADTEVLYLPLAAQAARDAYQNEAATRLLRRLSELVPQGGAAHIDALASLAEALDFMGETEPAIAACNEVLTLAPLAGRMASYARATTQLAQILRASGRYAEALRVIEQHGEHLGRHGDLLQQVRQLMTLTSVLQQVGRGEQAVETAQQAVQLAEAGDNDALSASAQTNYAFQLAQASRPTEAEALLLQSIGRLREGGRRDLLVQARSGLAALYIHMGLREEAESMLREVLAEARAIGHRRAETNALGNLGVALYEQGRADEALDCYSMALALCRESDSRAEEAHLLANVTSLYNSTGRFAEAAEAALTGLTIAHGVGNVPYAMLLQMYLSRALLFQGRLAAADACLRDGIETAREHDVELEHAAMLAYLANLLLLTGRKDEGERYLQLADESPAFLGDRWRRLRYATPIRCHFLMAGGETNRVRELLAQEAKDAAGIGGLKDYFDEVITHLEALEAADGRGDDSVMWQGYVIELLQPGLRRALAEYAVHNEHGRAIAAQHPAAATALKRLSGDTLLPDWNNPQWRALHTGGSFGMQRG